MQLDMDYTLAQYKPETFELLAYTLTVKKLITAFGYPAVWLNSSSNRFVPGCLYVILGCATHPAPCAHLLHIGMLC